MDTTNPHRDCYREAYDRGHRADQARHIRAEIAYERENERPAHLPHFEKSWEDTYTPAGPWEPAQYGQEKHDAQWSPW